jgi:hypothetical protein
MAMVLWRDEGPFAPSLDQGPVLAGLEGVAVRTEPVEEVETVRWLRAQSTRWS